MESILPPNLEASRRKIGKVHNRLALVMFVGAVAGLGVPMLLAPNWFGANPWSWLSVLFGLEVLAAWTILKYNDRHCRRLGYVCPECNGTLYEPRSTFYLDGECPKCKRQVIKTGR